MESKTQRACARYVDGLDDAGRLRLQLAQAVWTIQDDVAAETPAGEPVDAEQATDSLATHQPLFLMCPPEIAPDRFRAVARRIADAVADDAGLPEEVSEKLRGYDFDSSLTDALLKDPIRDIEGFTAAALDALGIDDEDPVLPAVMRFVLMSSLSAFMQSRSSEALDAVADFDWRVWGSGSCPVCGSPAALGRVIDEGELQGGRRMLWCSLCAAEWEYDRLRCVRCGSRDHEKLHYLMAEEDPGHRIHVCDSCHGYVKTVFERDLEHAAVPRVEDVVTLALDALAHSKGFALHSGAQSDDEADTG